MKSKTQEPDTSAHKPWRSSILLLISLLSLYFTVPAFGQEPSPTLAPSTSKPSTAPDKPPPTSKSAAKKPLEVLFVKGSLSVDARNATLKAIAEEIARKTGIQISLSPELEPIVVTVKFSKLDLETGLRKIFQAAGIANHAWAYQPSRERRKLGEWTVKRIFLLAEGTAAPDAPVPEKAPTSSGREKEPPAIRDKKEFDPNRETYFDRRSNRFVEVAAREVLVRFRKDLSDEEIEETLQSLEAQVISKHEKLKLYRLKIPATQSVSNFIQRNEAHPDLIQIEPNFLASAMAAEVIPDDPLFESQWALERIEATKAWKVTTGNQSVIVAVIDTGIDPNHPDLRGKVTAGRNIIKQDGNTMDDHGHGTAMAGVIAAATNNSVGIAGVCWSCRLMPIKVLDAFGVGTYADVIEGILWAADNGARILNLSLGGYVYSQLMADAVDYAHVARAVIVAAGGNEDTSDPLYPAANPNVIGVSATDFDDSNWSPSNQGSYIMLSAPGVGIVTTGLNEDYTVTTGTSLAAAHVSGVAAVVLSKNQDLSNTQVEQILYETADDLGDQGKDEVYGYGRVNAAKALGVASIEVHDVAVIGIRVEPQTFQIGEATQIIVTVQNQGTFVERNLSVAAFVNDTPVQGAKQILFIRPGESIDMDFTWLPAIATDKSTSIVLRAEVSSVQGEVDLEDNIKKTEFVGTIVNGMVVIKHKIHPPVHQHMAPSHSM